jgi:hypothetical protein
MRKFILITALLLASASAQAGESRSLTLASSEQPKPIEQVATKLAEQSTVQPTEAPAQATTTQAPAQTAAPMVTTTETAKPAATADTTSTAKPAKPAKKTHARRWEGDEAKARRIAARYGVYW